MKNIFSRFKSIAMALFAAALENIAPRKEFVPRMSLKQGGFVLLARPYAGYPAGQTVELPGSTEAALVQSGGASVSAGPPTPGSVTTTALSGCAGIAAGQTTITITNPNIAVQTQVYAQIVGAAADTTATSVRVNCLAGSVTLTLNAAATAAVQVDWCILNPNGSLSNPQ